MKGHDAQGELSFGTRLDAAQDLASMSIAVMKHTRIHSSEKF